VLRRWQVLISGVLLFGLAVLVRSFLLLGPESVKPKLILVLSIDQMRFDYLTRFGPLFKGGFRRLLDQGAVFADANYRHASTETGPGHAVILSGRHASHSGIVANSWYDRFLKKSINVVEDPVQSPVGGQGRGASPVNFIGFNLCDVLKHKSPSSRVVGVSLKDRSAILMAGRRADAAYWYENAGGNFITSTYYMEAAPVWLTEWNNGHFPDKYSGKSWTRLLDDEKLYEQYAGKDAVEGEWDRKDIVFPHAIRGKPPQTRFYDDFRRTPFADEMTLGVALKAMKAYELGADRTTDILALGFSATDIIGHTYGADSQEMMDQMLRLDLTLQKLFEEVEARVGLAETLVVLSADHGSLPLVEVLQGKGIQAKREKPDILIRAVTDAIRLRFPGVEEVVANWDEIPHVYLDNEVIQKNKLSREEVEATVTRALISTGLVEAVYNQTQLLGGDSPQDPFLPLFRNSFFQPRSPDLLVLLKKYVYLDDHPGGTGHGSAHDYDRHVPIVFMGPGIKPGKYDQPCGPEDIAPTLAKLLGLDYPKEDDSRLLLEILK
jgi:predicted AlkP superfamily pyrophosphatase or phosphodiesterase